VKAFLQFFGGAMMVGATSFPSWGCRFGRHVTCFVGGLACRALDVVSLGWEFSQKISLLFIVVLIFFCFLLPIYEVWSLSAPL
jgi:hypothetical protein